MSQQCATSTPVTATGAVIGTPEAVATDAADNVYFTTGNCVVKLDASGMLTRVAGTASSGFSGDGSAAMAAQLNGPAGLAADAAGNLYIADTGNHRIRMVGPDGNIQTIAGTGAAGYSGDRGPASAAALNGPQGLAADRFGDLYIADTNNNVVRRIAPTGVITTAAGDGTAGYSFDGFYAREAQLNLPIGVAVSSGNLYIADSMNNRVRLVTAAHLITTLAGNGVAGFSGDDGVGGQDEDAQLNLPVAVASDVLGLNIYISDSSNGRIRHVLPNTIITTAAAAGTPAGIALDSHGNLYIADSAKARILKLAPDGTVSTVAGK
jgi:sugar lactone lactonase YvrE